MTYLELIDRSPFSKAQWDEALVEFSHWELKNKRTLSLDNKIDYLFCVSQSQEAKSGLSDLTPLLVEFLEKYGVLEVT